jgi:hypothetical protein
MNDGTVGKVALKKASRGPTPDHVEYAMKRRSPHNAADLPVSLIIGGRRHPAVAENVSFKGLLVHTDAPAPSLRQLVPLEIQLPGRDRALRYHAVVVRSFRVGNPDGAQARVALVFYGIGEEQRAAWVRYVQHIAGKTMGGIPTRFGRGPMPHMVRLARSAVAGGCAAVVELRPRDPDELARLCERGDVFVATPLALQRDERVYVILVHPVTEQVFGVQCAVSRVVRDREVEGVGVELRDMDDGQRRALREFVQSGSSGRQERGAGAAGGPWPAAPRNAA